MSFGNVELVWPGWFWAIPSLCILIALPGVLLLTFLRYFRLSVWKKVLLVPACLIGPLVATSLWPLVLSLTGIVRVGDGTHEWAANWRTTSELFGDYSVYIWSLPTCLLVYAIFLRGRSMRQNNGTSRAKSVHGAKA